MKTKMLPPRVKPGLHGREGHFQMSSGSSNKLPSWGCNKNRIVNLYHPGWVRLAPARRIK